MKRLWPHALQRSVLAVLLLAASPLIAQADDGPYIGVEAGANWESPQNLKENRNVFDRVHFDTGFAAGITGGYSFVNGWRPELELDHRRNDLNHDFLGKAGGFDGADSALANIWYDFKAPSRLFSVLHPYLGVGVGAVRSYYTNAALEGVRVNDYAATEFGYQAGAGVSYDLTPNLTLSLDYRHLWTNRGSFHDTFNAPLESPASIEQRYQGQTAMLSVRYSFGARATAAAPVEPPAPPPLPPPPPTPPRPVASAPPPCHAPAGFKVDADCHIIEQTIVVRAVDFTFNSVQLTVPAHQTLDQVASALMVQPELKVEIQGHTDSTGSKAFNLKLSQRRAEAVKGYLIDKGVDGSTLTARGYGETMPAASNDTAEGRARNRRVAFEVTNTPAHVRVDTESASPASTEAAEQGEHSKTHKENP
ncbi:MAG: OmpA family protein [Steroidobacteraceae bacterium]